MIINKTRLWKRNEEIAHIGEDSKGGISRFAWTPDYKKAIKLLSSWMEDAGMTVHLDTVGNLYGRINGYEKGLPAVLTGSHLDTVPFGGCFDGTIGISAALEAIKTIAERNDKHRRPIEMVAFVNEEASQFLGGHFGSKAMCGMLPADHAKITKHRSTGQTLGDAMLKFGMGLDPNNYAGSIINRDDYYAFLELHIEQGQYLWKKEMPIAVVTSVAGIKQFYITLNGVACHAGGMALADRHDTLAAAAAIACEVERLALQSGSPTRGTVGYIESKPAEHNIVAGQSIIPVDFREDNNDIWAKLYDNLMEFVKKQCSKRGLTYSVLSTIDTPPMHCNPKLIEIIDQCARNENVPHMKMISYAAHDAMQIATRMPFGMIFLRSSNEGKSHCSEEYTTPEDAAIGTEVLYKSLLRIANEDVF